LGDLALQLGDARTGEIRLRAVSPAVLLGRLSERIQLDALIDVNRHVVSFEEGQELGHERLGGHTLAVEEPRDGRGVVRGEVSKILAGGTRLPTEQLIQLAGICGRLVRPFR
jgi:hypothetical protein